MKDMKNFFFCTKRTKGTFGPIGHAKVWGVLSKGDHAGEPSEIGSAKYRVGTYVSDAHEAVKVLVKMAEIPESWAEAFDKEYSRSRFLGIPGKMRMTQIYPL